MDEVTNNNVFTGTENRITFPQKRISLSVASLVFAILGFVPFVGFILGIIAIILGVSAKKKNYDLNVVSTLGIVIGILSIIAQPFLIIFLVSKINITAEVSDLYTNTLGDEKGPNYLTLDVPFTPISSVINEESIKFEIRNDAYEDITLQEFSVDLSTPSGATCASTNLNYISYPSSELKLFETGKCTGISRGNKVSGSMNIKYYVPGSSIPLYSSGTFSANAI